MKYSYYLENISSLSGKKIDEKLHSIYQMS